jgi:ABC-type polysaccharide/polyol phosphate export permease
MVFESMGVTINNSESRVKGLWPLIRSVVFGFIDGRYLAYRVAIRNIRVDYINTKLGFLWNFGEPVAYAIIFSILRKGQVFHLGTIEMPYGLYVLYGIFMYHLFCQSIVRPLSFFTENAGLLKQVKVPAESITLSALIRLFFDSLFPVVVLLLATLYYNQFQPVRFLFLVLMVPFLTLSGFSIGLLLTPFNRIYNDIGKLVVILLKPLLFISPIFYKIEGEGLLEQINQYNYFTFLLENIRALGVGVGEATSVAIIAFFAVPLFVFFLASILFNLAVPVLIDRG